MSLPRTTFHPMSISTPGVATRRRSSRCVALQSMESFAEAENFLEHRSSEKRGRADVEFLD